MQLPKRKFVAKTEAHLYAAVSVFLRNNVGELLADAIVRRSPQSVIAVVENRHPTVGVQQKVLRNF